MLRSFQAGPATAATSLPLCLETKTKIKHRNGSQGLWILIYGGFVCICQGYSSAVGTVLGKGAAQNSVKGEGIVLIFGAVSCLKS